MEKNYQYRDDKYVTFAAGNGTYVCSCPATHYRPYEACKHVREMVMDLALKASDLSVDVELDAVQDLLGGLPIGTVTGIFGTPGAGKTTLSFQLACDYIQQADRPGIIIDTEGSIHTYRAWWPILKDRYGLNEDAQLYIGKYQRDRSKKGNKYNFNAPKDVNDHDLVVVDVRDIRGILHMHGHGVTVEMKGKKVAIHQDPDHWTNDPFESPLGQYVVDTNAGFLTYDSISMPLKEIGIESQNLPQRSEATAYWMGPMNAMFQELSLSGCAIMHYMKDPTNKYDTPQFEGGKTLGHTFKFVLQMDEGRKKKVRRVQVWRHPAKGRFDEKAYLMFTNTGLVDTENP